MQRRRIAVVGCGTAGPAVSLFLAEQEHSVTLFERVPDPGPVGAGIILQPTGQAVLARLGLWDTVVPRGSRLDGLRIETSRRKKLAQLLYSAVRGEHFGIGLHRGLLFQALFSRVKSSSIDLRLGVGVEDVKRTAKGEQLLVDSEGNEHGPFDLVIVADGAKSHLRDDTDSELKKRVKPYPWGALWFVAEDHDGSYRERAELYQVVESTHRMLGLLPTGRGPRPEVRGDGNAESARDPLHVSLFWSVRRDRAEEIRGGDLGNWKDEARRLMPECEGVLAQINAPSDLLFAAYHDVQMPRWHTRDVVYIGDAAHAMSPQLGQGCNLALMDAMVLADVLGAHERVDEALAAYSRKRKSHLRFYQFATRWLTPFFQSDHRTLGFFRDAFMGIGSRIPFVRRQMIEAMCGIKRGFFSKSLTLPAANALPPFPASVAKPPRSPGT